MTPRPTDKTAQTHTSSNSNSSSGEKRQRMSVVVVDARRRPPSQTTAMTSEASADEERYVRLSVNFFRVVEGWVGGRSGGVVYSLHPLPRLSTLLYHILFSFLLFGSSSMRGSYLYLYIWRLSPYFRFGLLCRLCTGVGGGGWEWGG
jgi:hypothetical protein